MYAQPPTTTVCKPETGYRCINITLMIIKSSSPSSGFQLSIPNDYKNLQVYLPPQTPPTLSVHNFQTTICRNQELAVHWRYPLGFGLYVCPVSPAKSACIPIPFCKTSEFVNTAQKCRLPEARNPPCNTDVKITISVVNGYPGYVGDVPVPVVSGWVVPGYHSGI